MSPKDLPIQHPKKGKIKLGDLSKNEMCRYIIDLLKYQNVLKYKLDENWATYGNHIASVDAYGKQW